MYNVASLAMSDRVSSQFQQRAKKGDSTVKIKRSHA
jgi:hypothetical protein